MYKTYLYMGLTDDWQLHPDYGYAHLNNPHMDNGYSILNPNDPLQIS